MVLAPVVRGRKGEYGKLLEELRARGLHAREGRRRGAAARRGDRPRQEVQARHRGRRRPAGHAPRPAQAPGRLGRDRGRAGRRDGGDRDRAGATTRRAESDLFSERFACPEHGPSIAELEPRIFSFNSPARRLPALHRAWARRWRSTRSWSCPTRRCRSARGRSCRGPSSASSYYEQITQAIAERYEVDLDTPWEELPEEQRDLFLHGTNGDRIYVTYRNRMGRKRSYMTDASRASSPTSSAATARPTPTGRARRSRSTCRCGRARSASGARLRPESRAVTVGGDARSTSSPRCRRARALEWLDASRALRDRPRDRAADPARDRRAAALPRQRRRRLPVDGARGGDAVGRRGAAHPAGDPDRLVARRRALHPRRAVDRPAPARQRAADRDARAPARPRQHRDRRRARRGHDARGRPPASTSARAPASTAARSWPQGTAAEVERVDELADRAVPGRARGASRCPTAAAAGRGLRRDPGRDASTTSRTSTCSSRSASFTA